MVRVRSAIRNNRYLDIAVRCGLMDGGGIVLGIDGVEFTLMTWMTCRARQCRDTLIKLNFSMHTLQ